MNDQHNELQDLLKNTVTVNTNIVVRLQGGSYVLGKAVKKPYKLEQASGKSGGWINRGTWVVEMYQYEDDGAWAMAAATQVQVDAHCFHDTVCCFCDYLHACLSAIERTLREDCAVRK